MATQTVQSFIKLPERTEIRVSFTDGVRPDTLYHTQFYIDTQLEVLYEKHLKKYGKQFLDKKFDHVFEIVHGKPLAKSDEMKGAYLIVTTTFEDWK